MAAFVKHMLIVGVQMSFEP